MNWRNEIVVDPAICHGKACIRGTRVMVSVILDNLGDGVPVEQILKNYPSITRDQVQATMAYAAELARDRVVELSPAGSQ